tara:strand:+ start:222 stop:680 length:459 start_codon:yes stop_codon:yes gene_type:complete
MELMDISQENYSDTNVNLLTSLFESKCSCDGKLAKSQDYKNEWKKLVDAKEKVQKILDGAKIVFDIDSFLYGLNQLNKHYMIEMNNDPFAYNAKTIKYIRQINLILQESAKLFEQTLTDSVKFRIFQLEVGLFDIITDVMEIFEELQDIYIE